MKERPILFSTPMVQAILTGTKTQTRRLVKFGNKTIQNPEFGFTSFSPDGSISVRGYHMPSGEYGESFIKMPWQVGDLLWVREGFYRDQNEHPWAEESLHDTYTYKADNFHLDIAKPGVLIPQDYDMCIDGWFDKEYPEEPS